MKWFVITYIWIVSWAEYGYQVIRCEINRPVVWKDWPNQGICVVCEQQHNRRGN